MCSNVVLASEVLTDISLINDNDLSRVNFTALLRGLHAHTEAQWDVRDGKDDYTHVVWRVLCDTSEMTLKDVVAIQEGLFTVGLHPDLIFAVSRQVVQARDVELEFLGFFVLFLLLSS